MKDRGRVLSVTPHPASIILGDGTAAQVLWALTQHWRLMTWTSSREPSPPSVLRPPVESCCPRCTVCVSCVRGQGMRARVCVWGQCAFTSMGMVLVRGTARVDRARVCACGDGARESRDRVRVCACQDGASASRGESLSHGLFPLSLHFGVSHLGGLVHLSKPGEGALLNAWHPAATTVPWGPPGDSMEGSMNCSGPAFLAPTLAHWVVSHHVLLLERSSVGERGGWAGSWAKFTQGSGDAFRHRPPPLSFLRGWLDQPVQLTVLSSLTPILIYLFISKEKVSCSSPCLVLAQRAMGLPGRPPLGSTLLTGP